MTEAIWNQRPPTPETAGVGGQVGGVGFYPVGKVVIRVQKRYPRRGGLLGTRKGETWEIV